MAACNGWRLEGDPRGGHIPGARSIPETWTRFMDWVEVVEEKILDPTLPTTVYARDVDAARRLAALLVRLGFDDVDVYEAFSTEWTQTLSLPLDRLPRFEKLVYPAWLQARLGDGIGAGTDRSPIIRHANFDFLEDYEVGHIPGAVPLNTNLLEDPATWNRRPPDELEETLCSLGIRADSTVVLNGRYSHPSYDQDHPAHSAGHLAAMRCAAIMMYAGVEDVRILNGGMNAWEQTDLPVSTSGFEPDAVQSFGREIPARPDYFVDLEEAHGLLESADGELVSIRSWDEFVGNSSGYHYIDAKGRIPGAVFGNCGSDAYHMENYRNFDYTTREYTDIERAWREGGILPDKHIAFYCGTGWRASEAFINAWLMDWPRISVFDGGWFEWSSRPDLPFETGSPLAAAV